MKSFLQKILLVAVIGILIVSAGCGRDVEVVIDGDTQDITEPGKAYEKLSTSTASKFSFDDLIAGELKYFMTESEVQDILGEPLEIEDLSDKNKEIGIPEEKVYHYNGRTLTFSNIDDVYVLTAFSSERSDDIFARDLIVGANNC